MYSEIRLSTHAFVPKRELLYDLETLRNNFTLVSKYDPNISIKTYQETELYFGYPLYYTNFSLHTHNIIDERRLGQAISFNMIDGFKLRDSQEVLINKFRKAYNQGKTGYLLSMSTGGGKTLTAIYMLQILKRTALVIVPRDNLINQWIERILQFTTLKREDIGIAKQDVCEYQDKSIVIGMIHSLVKDKYPEEFKNYFGVLIIDETHTIGTQTFSQSLNMFPAKYKLGMSATIERKDNLTNVYAWALGEVFLAPPTNNTLVQPKVFLRHYATAQKHPYVSTMKDAKSRRGVLISALSQDVARNALIAIYAKKFMDSDRRVVIFSDRVEQLKILRDLLVKRHRISLATVGLFTGSTKEGDRKIILEHSSIILATYGVMAMGVDVPNLRAVIFATPLSDVAQSVGRILRLCENVKEPVVLDIIDSDYADCIHWSRARQNYYINIAKAELINVK